MKSDSPFPPPPGVAAPVHRELFDRHIHRDPAINRTGSWIVCQIGAREHYAIPRALHRKGMLAELLTDFWISPGHAFGALPGARRVQDRYHQDLVYAHCWAPNARMLAFEAWQRLRKRGGWKMVISRNNVFQKAAVARLEREFAIPVSGPQMTLFSYSYAALKLFRYAKSRGWNTVLGQIDPGPEEERIVRDEHRRYPHLASGWTPMPPDYWDSWRKEVALADKIVVNSPWSMDCLIKENVPAAKMQVIPLVYDEKPKAGLEIEIQRQNKSSLQVLFLGQINLRKGIGRLLEAMRLVADQPIELTLAGPTEIDPRAWADMANVRWVGSIPRSEVNRVYRESDVFILPTLSDGYALTQLEALFNGLPVISSRQCGEAVIDGVNGWILGDLEPTTIRDVLLKAQTADRGRRKGAGPAFDLDNLANTLTGF